MEDERRLVSEVIDDNEFVEWFCSRNRAGNFKIVVYEGMKAMETSIDDLNLTVRSANCLRRAGFDTVSSLVEKIGGRKDLVKIRNLGSKSAEEIMLKLFLFNYANLEPERRKIYLNKIKRVNSGEGLGEPRYECTV